MDYSQKVQKIGIILNSKEKDESERCIDAQKESNKFLNSIEANKATHFINPSKTQLKPLIP